MKPSDLEGRRPPICCSCEGDLPPDFEWTHDGRGRCPGCPEPPKLPPPKEETLTEFAARKARSAMHGRGQKSLLQ